LKPALGWPRKPSAPGWLWNLDQAARLESIRDAAASIDSNPGNLQRRAGGRTEDAAYVLSRTHGVAGYLGASSRDRLPADHAITEQVQKLKSSPLALAEEFGISDSALNDFPHRVN